MRILIFVVSLIYLFNLEVVRAETLIVIELSKQPDFSVSVDGSAIPNEHLYQFPEVLVGTASTSSNQDVDVTINNDTDQQMNISVVVTAGGGPGSGWVLGGLCSGTWCMQDTSVTVPAFSSVTTKIGTQWEIYGKKEATYSFRAGVEERNLNVETTTHEDKYVLQRLPTARCTDCSDIAEGGTPGVGLIASSARGVNFANSYTTSANVAVNALNGNLTAFIPLGQSYSVGPVIEYSLGAYYNSKIWLAKFKSDHLWYGPADTNAGLGWDVSLGRLYNSIDANFKVHGVSPASFTDGVHTWAYVSPDGAVTNIVYDQTDGRIRVEELAEGVKLHFGDGTYKFFEKSGSDYRITQIGDNFGNTVDISYSANGGYIISDPFRSISVNYEVSGTDSRERGALRHRVSDVVVATFGVGIETYTFTYEVQDVSRRYSLTNPPDPDEPSGPASQFMEAPMLTSIDSPSGGTWTITPGNNFGGQQGVKAIKSPTQLTSELSYRHWIHPTDCSDERASQDAQYKISGVKSHSVKNAAGELVQYTEWDSLLNTRKKQPFEDTWRYEDFGVNCSRDNLLTTTVTEWNKQGTYSESTLYHTLTNRDLNLPQDTDGFEPIPGDWRAQDYATNVHKGISVGSGAGKMYLSSSVKSCKATDTYDPVGINYSECETNPTNTYLRYAIMVNAVPLSASPHDTVCDGNQASRYVSKFCWKAGEELMRKRTVFPDGNWVQESYSQNDGLGHWRTQTTTTNIPNSGTTVAKTNYNPHLAVKPWALQAESFMLSYRRDLERLPEPDTWLLDLYDEKMVVVDGKTTTQKFDFDPGTGFLNCQRTLSNLTASTESANDLIVQYAHDDSQYGHMGLVTSESYGGGDNGDAGASGCAGTFDYFKTNTISNGRLATSYFTDSGGMQVGALLADNTIDANTGLVSQACDAGSCTVFSYDKQGRIATETPDGLAQKSLTYALRAAGGHRVVVNDATRNRFLFDELGRETGTEVDLANDVTVSVNSTFSADGKLLTRSTPNKPTQKYTLDYDSRGRISSTTTPNNHVTSVNYVDEHQTTTTSSIDGNLVPVTKVKDAYGRLVSTSIAGVQSTAINRNAGTDSFTLTDDARGLSQSRSSTRDGRGLMVSESHPELNNAITYGYDALGNIVTRTEGDRVLTSHYNAAGQLESVNEGERVWKEYTYDSSGRVDTATRHHYFDDANTFGYLTAIGATHVTVKSTYSYSASSGISDGVNILVKTGNDRTLADINQSWTHDPYRAIKSENYATCTGEHCSLDVERTVKYRYNNGMLDLVYQGADADPDKLATVNYAENGAVNLVRHFALGGSRDSENISREVFTPSPINMRGQLQRIVHQKMPGNIDIFDSGAFSYDAVDNITTMGSDTFDYNELNQLTSANISSGTYNYNYDAFGNNYTLTQGKSISVTTNRLDGTNVVYNPHGELTQLADKQVSYDVFGKIIAERDNNYKAIYLYTDENLRIAIYDEDSVGADTIIWTTRSRTGELQRDIKRVGSTTQHKDYIYRTNSLLAVYDSSQTGAEKWRHMHLDHLDQPRSSVNNQGGNKEIYSFKPYGEFNDTSPSGTNQRIGFSGTETDRNGNAPSLQLDGAGETQYMKARTYQGGLGRFLSPDPAKDTSAWSLYAYAANNPINYIDTSGLKTKDVAGKGASAIKVFQGAKDVGGKLSSLVTKALDGKMPTPQEMTDLSKSVISLTGDAISLAGGDAPILGDVGLVLDAKSMGEELDKYANAETPGEKAKALENALVTGAKLSPALVTASTAALIKGGTGTVILTGAAAGTEATGLVIGTGGLALIPIAFGIAATYADKKGDEALDGNWLFASLWDDPDDAESLAVQNNVNARARQAHIDSLKRAARQAAQQSADCPSRYVCK